MKDNSNISQELLETIELYYNGSMTDNERIVFEERLSKDATFKAQVESIKTLLFGIEAQALKEKLDDFHKDIPAQLVVKGGDSKVRFLHFRKIAVAAIVIVALGSFWFFNGSSNDRLYANYFSPDPGLPTTMSTSDDFPFYDAMVNYKQGDYKKAIAKWEVLQKNQPNNDTINYFIGVAHLANKNETTAIRFLEKTASQSKSIFISDANYYLGLAYLKKNDKANATKFLKLSDTEKSKELLKKLD